MLDGKTDTRWGTENGMAKNDWIAVDFGKALAFNALILNQGQSGGDYPQEYDVFTSTDGQRWGRPVVTGKGNDGATVFSRKAKYAIRESCH